MEPYKLGVKVFAENGADLDLERFIPIFHRWIQEQSVPGHLLIDVHDYSHVPNGPGILLVAHEGNFSTDMDQGRLGLFYYRKQPIAGDLSSKLDQIVKVVLTACEKVEREPGLDGIKFRTGEMLVTTNDRLLAPNTPEGAAQLKTAVSRVVGNAATITVASTDPRERLALHVKRA